MRTSALTVAVAPISSRKMVPPSASAKRPGLSFFASIKALSCNQRVLTPKVCPVRRRSSPPHTFPFAHLSCGSHGQRAPCRSHWDLRWVRCCRFVQCLEECSVCCGSRAFPLYSNQHLASCIRHLVSRNIIPIELIKSLLFWNCQVFNVDVLFRSISNR